MISIDKLLKKTKNKLLSKDRFIKDIISIINEVSGINIEKANVRYIKGIIMISDRPIVRTEIFLNKEEILKQITNQIHEYKVIDIR